MWTFNTVLSLIKTCWVVLLPQEKKPQRDFFSFMFQALITEAWTE